MNAVVQNDNFTRLGEYTKTQLEEQLKEILFLLLSREEVDCLIDEFIIESPDVKPSIEIKIIDKLVMGDSFTDYYKEHGNRPVCDYDKCNADDVKNVAKKYCDYAKKIPCTADANADKKELYEQKIIEILSSIVEGCRTSGDHITRLVNQRIDVLSPEIKNENDSTRLLIFKQALKSLEFSKGKYLSKELTKHICEITGLSKKASEEEIANAIKMLTDNDDDSVTNVFNKLKDIENIISNARKDYDELVDKYNVLSDKHKSVKNEYNITKDSLSNQKRALERDKETAERELQRTTRSLNIVSQSITRDESKLQDVIDAESRNKIETRMADNKKELDNLKALVEEKSMAFKDAEAKLTEVENEINDCNSNYNKLRALYEKLEAEKKYLAKEKDRKRYYHRDLQRNYNKNWEPLFWADDLGRGFFNDQQTTRKKLYWFAIIFKMTFFSGAFNEIRDHETDIQKNLFYDFYADNLLNNLMIDDANELRRIEKEPSGHGINVKNYVEVIYLYYLCRSDMTPLEKICAAEEMIERCKTEDEAVINKQIQTHHNKGTFFYESVMDRLLSISADDPDALYKYIQKNYICGTTSNATPIRIASGNNDASEVYEHLLSGLKQSAIEIEQQIDELDELSYVDDELECKSTAAKQIITLSQLCGDAIRHIEDKTLKALLQRIEDKFYFIRRKKTIEECIDSTFVPKRNPEEDVSRTRLIVLYYFLVGLEYLNEGVVFSDFKKFYDEFCENKTIRIISSKSDEKDIVYKGLNSCLCSANYQEINPKNIFDITVLFFAFKKFAELSSNPIKF